MTTKFLKLIEWFKIWKIEHIKNGAWLFEELNIKCISKELNILDKIKELNKKFLSHTESGKKVKHSHKMLSFNYSNYDKMLKHLQIIW